MSRGHRHYAVTVYIDGRTQRIVSSGNTRISAGRSACREGLRRDEARGLVGPNTKAYPAQIDPTHELCDFCKSRQT